MRFALYNLLNNKHEGDLVMKKMKSIISLCVTLIITLAFCACTGSVRQGVNNPDAGTFGIEQIQDEPASYVGKITLIGIVANSSTQDFALENETGTFEILVDYRGSQALPQVGDKVEVEGQLTQNRPCCGPGFTIMSTRFERVE